MEFDKKLKIPTCTKCRNHDVFNVPLKGHGKYCAFRDCSGWKCNLIEERHETNKRKRELNEAEVEAITAVSTKNADEKKSLSKEALKNQCDKLTSDSTKHFDESKELKASGVTDEQPLSKKSEKSSDNLDDKHKVTRKKRNYTKPTKQMRAKQVLLAPSFQPALQHIQPHPYAATPLAACVRPTPHNMSYTYPFNAARTTPISSTFTTMAHDSLLCSHYQGEPYTYQQTVARIGPNQAATPSPLLMPGEVLPVEHPYEALDNLYWYLSPPNVCVSTRPSTLPHSLPTVRVPRYQENYTPE